MELRGAKGAQSGAAFWRCALRLQSVDHLAEPHGPQGALKTVLAQSRRNQTQNRRNQARHMKLSQGDRAEPTGAVPSLRRFFVSRCFNNLQAIRGAAMNASACRSPAKVRRGCFTIAIDCRSDIATIATDCRSDIAARRSGSTRMVICFMFSSGAYRAVEEGPDRTSQNAPSQVIDRRPKTAPPRAEKTRASTRFNGYERRA
jgi:hypothetical protein